MTTRDYADAYADDSENVRGWPQQDAQMPPNDSDVAYLRAEIAALKVERAHTMSWYKTVCELLTEKSATIARVEKMCDDADAFDDDAVFVTEVRAALAEPTS